MFLFLFLLAYLPPTFLKESRKNIFNSCVLVGAHVYFELGEFFLKFCSLAAPPALQEFRLWDASRAQTVGLP